MRKQKFTLIGKDQYGEPVQEIIEVSLFNKFERAWLWLKWRYPVRFFVKSKFKKVTKIESK